MDVKRSQEDGFDGAWRCVRWRHLSCQSAWLDLACKRDSAIQGYLAHKKTPNPLRPP